MALSQYVAINFLTKFDKKGLERATKELKGFDKVVATGSFRLKAFAKAGGVAAVAGLALFTTQSIKAALAQEKLDKQLQLTLKSIGQEFALPDVKNFVADLQRATNITEDQLVPALQKLIAQTSNLESSQYLLSKALDISAGTGADLDTVLNAINKAAIGSYDSIAKLGIGFTTTEAKSMGFIKLMQNLDKYAGSAEAQTKTFAGQLEAFKISAGEATETLGNGFLIASSYIVTGEGDLKKFGIALESIASKVSDTFIGFGKVLSEEGVFKALITSFKELGEEGFKVRQKQYLQEKGYLGLSQFGIDALELQLKYGKQELTREQILAKIQKDILAREKATTKEKRAQEALDKKKGELSAMFDLDRINLQVSLSRKLTAEDELRVKILQKLTDGTTAAVNEAQRYADILKVIDDGKISDAEIATLAKTWGITTTEVVLYISKLMTANDELRKMIGLASQVNVGTPSVAPTSTDKYDEIKKSLEKEFISRGIEKGAASGLAASSVRLQAQADAYMAANPGMFDPLTGLRRVALAEGGIVTKPTNALIGEAGAEAVIPLDRMGGFGTTVNVNVAGSVISEGELQSVIQDALYNLNRAGAVTQLTNLGR
jgi:ribosomal protein S21